MLFVRMLYVSLREGLRDINGRLKLVVTLRIYSWSIRAVESSKSIADYLKEKEIGRHVEFCKHREILEQARGVGRKRACRKAQARARKIIREKSILSCIIKIKFTVDKGSARRRGRGVCTEIRRAELWRFMELPIAARANTGPAVARYSSRAKCTGS